MRSGLVFSVVLAALVTAGVAGEARADPVGFLSPGLVYSNVWGRSPAHGFGLELSYMVRPRNTSSFGIGAFTQGQAYTDGSWRFAGGVQGAWSVVGLELGLGHRTGTDLFAPTTSLHVAPYLSAGVVTVALRFSVPLGAVDPGPNAGGPAMGQGPETALTIALKFPVRTHGQLPQCGCSGGRGRR